MRRRMILSFPLVAVVSATAASASARATERKYDPGVSDTEIKIGQTMPYSGPASSFGTQGHTAMAYYKMINDRGGINGRTVTVLSLDDGYSPPKTVEQTRRLVEQEQVLAMVGTIGTPTNPATLEPAGLDKSIGVITAEFLKQSGDSRTLFLTQSAAFSFEASASPALSNMLMVISTSGPPSSR